MKGVYVIIPVWGEAYTRRWLEFSLPSLLADGNLPAVAQRYSTKVLLYTTREDLDLILPHPAVTMLRDIAPLRVNTIADRREDATKQHSGNLMVKCHGAGLMQAWNDDHGVFGLVADSVFGNTCFASACEHINAGKRAVVTQGFGVLEDEFGAQLDSAGLRNQTALSIPHRTLVRIMFETMHPAWAAKFWDAPQCTSHPGFMYWRLGERSLLMRVWHLYPMFIYPERPPVTEGSLDDNLITVALSDPASQCAALDDSDACMFVDVMDSKKRHDLHSIQVMPHPYSVDYVASWAEKWARPPHCFNVWNYKFWVHDGPLDRAQWRHVEAQSDAVLERIIAAIARSKRPIGTHLPRSG
jgi:hypothetical protein